MKAFGILAAAGFFSSVVAQPHMRRADHSALHRRHEQHDNAQETCACTTTVYQCPDQTGPAKIVTTTVSATTYLTNTIIVTETHHEPLPTQPAAGSDEPGVPRAAETLSSSADVVILYNTRSTYICPEGPTPGLPNSGVQPTTGVKPSSPAQSNTPALPPAQSSVEPTTTVHRTQTVGITTYVTQTAHPSTPAAPIPVTSQPPAPTHHITTFTAPGTYTISERTITLTSTATVCDATSTPVGPGEHTFGGVTTIVSTHTTVTCPIATTSAHGTDVTSFITHTTFVCPSAGTYTIGTLTTSVPASSTVVYPTPATYTPGTYHQPATVVTVTDTNSVYVCPANPTPVGASSTPVAASTTTAVTQSTHVASSTPSSTPNSGNSKKAYGMTFSPYTTDGQCMKAEDVDKNIAKIAAKGIPAVRVYGTDCDGLENIGNACKKHGLKMIIGIFIDNKGIPGAESLVHDIVNWGLWELVDLIVVGNEAILQGYCTATELAGFITTVTSTFKGAGYSGSITTAEPISVWEESGSVLCPVVDVLGANLHPFFNAKTKAADAGTFVKSQFELLHKVCNGKRVINLETGWPNAGGANGEAIPGKSEQKAAIDALIQEVGEDSVFFSYEDDGWKDPGQFNVEQHWGCFDQL